MGIGGIKRGTIIIRNNIERMITKKGFLFSIDCFFYHCKTPKKREQEKLGI